MWKGKIAVFLKETTNSTEMKTIKKILQVNIYHYALISMHLAVRNDTFPFFESV